jgi:hypothetical protein
MLQHLFYGFKEHPFLPGINEHGTNQLAIAVLLAVTEDTVNHGVISYWPRRIIIQWHVTLSVDLHPSDPAGPRPWNQVQEPQLHPRPVPVGSCTIAPTGDIDVQVWFARLGTIPRRPNLRRHR